MAKPIPQSDTKWVPAKKDKQGKVVKPGYLIQRSTGKKVTGKVKISSIGSTAYNEYGVASYKKGRNTAVAKPSSSGNTGGSKAPAKPKGQTMAQAGASAGRRQAAMAAERKPTSSRPKITPPKAGDVKGGPTGGRSVPMSTAPSKAYEERKARPAPKRKEYGGLEKAGRAVASGAVSAAGAIANRLTGPAKGAIKYETQNGKRVKFKYNGSRWIKQL